MGRAMCVALIALGVSACGDDRTTSDPEIDGGMASVPPDAPPDARPPGGYDYFGESCVLLSPPEVISRCRGADGVCVAEVCRPACAHVVPPCPSGQLRHWLP